MKANEALAGARGQIVWIVALAASTATIIQLERLDIGAPPATVAGTHTEVPRDIVLASDATGALAAAAARVTAEPDDPTAAASLLLALSVAVKAGSLDREAGRTRALALIDKAAEAGPAWDPVLVLARQTFSP
ncbi:hypothetical protein [Tabrizicola sp. BL-A-41-H6]|uniref:hypothetical protein n=1 Tax=Tabrizicola sp. BL-A-41-H6 TaxID=3421107 RepID=UPI003D66E2AF